jgi:hypothetical protein
MRNAASDKIARAQSPYVAGRSTNTLCHGVLGTAEGSTSRALRKMEEMEALHLKAADARLLRQQEVQYIIVSVLKVRVHAPLAAEEGVCAGIHPFDHSCTTSISFFHN